MWLELEASPHPIGGKVRGVMHSSSMRLLRGDSSRSSRWTERRPSLLFACKKKSRRAPINIAGELDFHSCAVSQLLVGRRHRFGICVPETQSGPAVP